MDRGVARAEEKKSGVKKMSVFDMAFEDMRGLYIPEKQKARILDRYGKLTISDLDRLFDINTKIGARFALVMAPACRRCRRQ